MDTIDIEDFAGKVKIGLVSFFTELIYSEAVSLLPWLATPVISTIAEDLIQWAVTIAATKGGLVAFFINTKVYTTDQASDYMTVIAKLNELPDDVSDEEWDKAERAANEAFVSLVNFKH